jgi:hypothetical protein
MVSGAIVADPDPGHGNLSLVERDATLIDKRISKGACYAVKGYLHSFPWLG